MKQLTAITLALAVLSLLFTACEPDPVDPVSPTLSIEQGGNFVSEGDVIFTGTTFQTKITATSGDMDLNRIEVQENGTAIDFSRLVFDGDPAGSNPSPLGTDFATGFTWVITVTAPDVAGTNTYTVIVADTEGKTGSSSFDLEIVEAKPVVEVVDEEGFAMSGDEILPSLSFDVKITAAPGAADLTTVEVLLDGTAIDAAAIQIDGTEATANPAPVADAAGFTSVFTLTAPEDKSTTYTYSFIVSDADGQSTQVDVELTTADLNVMTMVLLLNQGGPSGTGGVDLHTGKGTGSSDPTADIRDQGINAAGSFADNWIQKIAPVNGSDLRLPANDFSFNEIASATQISDAFNMATSVATESEKVAIGDEFLVLSDGTYFAIQVTDIVVTTEPIQDPNCPGGLCSDNSDYYEFNVKF